MKALKGATRKNNRRMKEIKEIEKTTVPRQWTEKMSQDAVAKDPLLRIGYPHRKQNLIANNSLTSQT